ncbi:endoribonuclease LACTB2, partial [Phenoliferia sp. Uapishka_3]
LILIDTAQGLPQYIPSLKEALSTYSSPHVTDIILTHWHQDHIGGLSSVLELCAGMKMSPPPRVWKYKGEEKDDERVEEILGEVPEERFRRSGDGGNEWFWRLSEGQVFQADIDVDQTTTLQIIHTPGHTLDSICLFSSSPSPSAPSILFTADTVLGHGTAVFEDLGAYMSSLRVCLDKMGEVKGEVELFPGHGEIVVDGRAKIEEYLRHRVMREEQVLKGLRESSGGEREMTASSLTEKIYANTIPESLIPAATRGIILHLEKLEKEGQVDRISIPTSSLEGNTEVLLGWNDGWRLVPAFTGGKM